MKPEFRELEIAWPSATTLVWDQDELVDVTTRERRKLDGSRSQPTWIIGYEFDRAIGLRHSGVFWAVAYTNRATKAVLLKDGQVHRELNRSLYCAGDYDYPIAIAANHADRVVVAHCPQDFGLLEIEDAESGDSLRRIKSELMEFHSRLAMSADGRYLLDAGWFWHPRCGACVFDVNQASDSPSAILENAAFSATNEIDSAAFLGNTHLVVSSAPEDSGGKPQPNDLRPKQLGVWSLADRRWELKIDLSEPTGIIMPWKEWIVSFYGHPKLVERATGRIVHRWDQVFSGKQVGPINLGDPPPPPMAIDGQRGRFAVADSKKITVVAL